MTVFRENWNEDFFSENIWFRKGLRWIRWSKDPVSAEKQELFPHI